MVLNLFWCRFIQAISTLSVDEFTTDNLIQELLIFGANTDLHNNHLYLEGKLILQDKVENFFQLSRICRFIGIVGAVLLVAQ